MTDKVREECIFCRIAYREIPTPLLYEDDQVVAFKDISPLAPSHILIIPKQHISSLMEITAEQEALLGRINYVATCLAQEQGLADGYRLVCNCGKNSGQEVFHLHYHLLGGRSLGPFTTKS